jgi:ABC-type dipeptide/oligopeptide/nickel transport system ATPase subunit
MVRIPHKKIKTTVINGRNFTINNGETLGIQRLSPGKDLALIF